MIQEKLMSLLESNFAQLRSSVNIVQYFYPSTIEFVMPRRLTIMKTVVQKDTLPPTIIIDI